MNLAKPSESDTTPLDEAARAAWLYYVGGKTQDQIARELGISRQRAQRLVSKAVAEGLISFRLEHGLSSCLELEAALTRRFGLELCRVAPSLGAGVDPTRSIASVTAVALERFLSASEPIVVALGTGRTLRAAVESLPAMDCAHHKLVSLNGNISPDGTASHYDVIMRIADKVHAPHYPMPLPVIAASARERDMFHALEPIQRTMELARNADVTFVGIGQMDEGAPLLKDGFLSEAEIASMQEAGAAGEIVGWIFDESGRYLDFGPNLRAAGVRVDVPTANIVISTAAGASKVTPLHAALKGRLINGLITDEPTARDLLDR
ncbi:DNA-binding transcriptional regulator LsrR (DeoR family) [Aliiruegeria haliotis]|uniref:DNA-binding transcriptional regulator LsrR (DeoR family) n=1 Tax=Aliiruegeria haliotis TaxID=1280846 RepID=A0A2T0RUR3_9RHOB|nr:sugar-binding transcriptional regulator [Aliiruegeria haliotis]PRY24878.1 DNA-binding transcriptional regulator LsrR (DeoR family) [Aliiruegeria haliotis]